MGEWKVKRADQSGHGAPIQLAVSREQAEDIARRMGGRVTITDPYGNERSFGSPPSPADAGAVESS